MPAAVVRWIILPRPTHDPAAAGDAEDRDRDGAHRQDGDASGRPEAGRFARSWSRPVPAVGCEARPCRSPVPRPTSNLSLAGVLLGAGVFLVLVAALVPRRRATG